MSALAPAPLESTRSRILFLFRRAPTAAVVALASGAVTGSFWTLGAFLAPLFVGQLVAPLGPGGLFWGCAAVSATATLLVAALCQRPAGTPSN